MSTTHIFLTGATGYVGGTVLHALLHSSNASKYNITVLARPTQAGKLRTFDVRIAAGTLDDLDLLLQEASSADIVLHTASSTDLAAAQALAAGLAKRKSEGKPAHLIHTSGLSIISEPSNGDYRSENVFRDTDDVYALEKADQTWPFRKVDVTLVDAAEKGGFGVNILVPSRQYGAGTGLFKRNTTFVQLSVRAAIKERRVRHYGAGLNLFSHGHIEDLASLYVVLVDAVRAGTAPSGKEGYLYAETGEHQWKDLSDRIARILYARGLVGSPQSTPHTSVQEAADAFVFGSTAIFEKFFTSNGRARGVRSRQLGWKPVHSSDDFLETLEEQIDFIIEQDGLSGDNAKATASK